MKQQNENLLYNIFPDVLYTVNRVAIPSWFLNDKIKYHNLMLVYDGKSVFTCNSEVKIACAGDLVYFKPGDVRTARTFAESPVKSFAVDFTYLCPVFQGNRWQTFAPPLPFSFSQRLREPYLLDRLITLFSKMNEAALSELDQSNGRVRAIFTEILHLLIRSTEKNNFDYSSVKKVETVIHFMIKHFSEPITLTQLADYAHISESYLGKIFKTVTGKAPVDYLIGIRINHAKTLLKEGISVTEASQMTGFNDIYYFSRTFKKREGVSPSAFAMM